MRFTDILGICLGKTDMQQNQKDWSAVTVTVVRLSRMVFLRFLVPDILYTEDSGG